MSEEEFSVEQLDEILETFPGEFTDWLEARFDEGLYGFYLNIIKTVTNRQKTRMAPWWYHPYIYGLYDPKEEVRRWYRVWSNSI